MDPYAVPYAEVDFSFSVSLWRVCINVCICVCMCSSRGQLKAMTHRKAEITELSSYQGLSAVLDLTVLTCCFHTENDKCIQNLCVFSSFS